MHVNESKQRKTIFVYFPTNIIKATEQVFWDDAWVEFVNNIF